MGKAFTHLDASGAARMVDVSSKNATRRMARAEAYVNVGEKIADQLRQTGGVAKGNVIECARIAGIMAAKRTGDLIPLCHPLVLDSIDVAAELEGIRVHILATVMSEGKTGVEMEALVAASVAALTVYDMCKAAGKGIEIERVRLLEKAGGKSGRWTREANDSGKR